MEERDYQEFIHKINTYLGIDLSLYKEGQMKRRLHSLYTKKGYKTFGEYFEAIKKNIDIRDEFLERITINVTEFFRNTSCWDKMESRIIPELLKKRSKLKIWSAACSTGEEPYTTVMVLNRFFNLNEIEVIATDIDETVIKRAKEGVYTENAVRNCSPEDIKKYFIEENGVYKIKEEVKKCVTFKKQDLLKDQFNQNFDLIICRNVMIYFTEEAKDMLYNKFSNALSEDGVFFVGSTEQIFYPNKYNLKVADTFFYKRFTN